MSKIILILLAHFPLSVLHLIAHVVAFAVFRFSKKRWHISDVNLSFSFPELNQAQRNRLCWRSMISTCKGYMEAIKFWLDKPEKTLRLVREVSGKEILQQALQQNKGVIMILPHLGNWEIINFYCSTQHSISCLYKPQKVKWLDQLILDGRQKLGAKLIPATTYGVKSLYSTLRDKGMVLILPDQNPGKGKGVFAKFFGVATNTPVLPSRLAKKTGAPILLCYAERLPFSRGFHIHFQSTPNELASTELETACTSMNQTLETVIKAKPEQYWWSYERFRHRPDGEPPIY